MSDVSMAAIHELKDSSLNRIRSIWETLQLVVEEVIIGAEQMADLTGEEKKDHVVGQVTRLMRDLEEKHNVVPGWAEMFAFRALSLVLGLVVDRVFRKLNDEGKVNAGK